MLLQLLLFLLFWRVEWWVVVVVAGGSGGDRVSAFRLRSGASCGEGTFNARCSYVGLISTVENPPRKYSENGVPCFAVSCAPASVI